MDGCRLYVREEDAGSSLSVFYRIQQFTPPAYKNRLAMSSSVFIEPSRFIDKINMHFDINR